MKIDKNTPPLPASQIGEHAPKSPNARQAGGSVAEKPAAQISETRVHLGSSSTQLHKIEQSMAGSPTINREKVEEIKRAISEGHFQINSSAIADRLIDNVQEMINTSKSGQNKA